VRLPFDPDAVPRLDADLVVNLVEGYEEPIITRLLEAAGLPFTGSSAATLGLALDKRLARAALTAAGVPVPQGCVLAVGDEPIVVRFPAVVKPSREDASHGVTLESIVENSETARARATYLIQRYQQPALVEEFIAGAEFSVSLLGPGGHPEVLPLTQIHFSGSTPLLTYAAKWLPDSAEYQTTLAVPADANEHIADVAVAAWNAVGGRDYGRVDVRVSSEAEPFVIDVNPNPDLTPDSEFAQAASRAGISYTELIGRIVDAAALRGTAPSSASI
jgi:D-alanine-D-alanine ligase